MNTDLHQRVADAYEALQRLQLQPTKNNVTILSCLIDVLEDVYQFIGEQKKPEEKKEVVENVPA